MRKVCFVFTLTLLAVASCAAATGDERNRNFNPPATRTVSGTRIIHFKNGPVPVDLSTRTIAALVPDGSGGYKVLAGTGTSSGTFTIPNVPNGFYLLQISANYVWTSHTVVDVDSFADYRSDTVQADQNTQVRFDLTNLRSWQSTDFLELVCPNNLSFNFFPGTVGETTFTGTFPYLGNLSVGSEGDQYYIAQLSTQNLGGYAFTGLARYMKPARFNQAQRSTTPINGRLRTIAQNHKFEANINGADLAAQALAANPGAVLFGTGVGLDVYPGSFSHGQNTDTTDLVILNGGPPFLVTNGDLGQVLYGNPYPSNWPPYAFYSWYTLTSYFAPGATNSAPILTGAFGSTLKLPTATSPITPLAGVVSKPSINGKNFFKDQIGVGTTPILKWSAPKVGAANNYLVQIAQLSNNGGNTAINFIATFYTQTRSLTVPPGLLSTGSGYVFVIQSDYIPGVNFAKTPLMNGSTSASAQVASGVMQP